MAKRFIISGGGTGGHIFPAIAIADEITAQLSDADILFVGAQGRMEMQRVPAAGYAITGLNIAGFQRRLTAGNLAFPFKVMGSLLKATSIIRNFKPDAAIGVGGYASGPILFAAALMGVPTLIQEQNGYAGITNKILAAYTRKICVAYPDMDKYFPKAKLILTGNPVRADILESVPKAEAAGWFNLQADKPTVLIIGGSLGARTLNESIAAGLNQLIAANIQVIWQTGKAFEEKATEMAKAYNGVVATAFINRMDYAYAMADVVVSRAGALSISELCIAAKPVILVPSPNVAEDHQTRNAMALVRKEAALMVSDKNAAEQLINTLLAIMKNTNLRNKLALNIKALAMPQAAKNIVNEILAIAT